jgi:cob(I)alamin adenosyltransferase
MTNDKHQQRMQRLKQAVDKKVAQAQQEKGLLLIFTGNGKGKSTAGFGTITRAIGHGLTAACVQFIKGDWPCGERDVLTKLGVEFHVMATGFTWDTQDKASDIKAAQTVWQQAKRLLQDPTMNMVLLDELTYMLSYKYLDLDEVITTLTQRPPHQHVIITGRQCHRRLLAIADTISEINAIKHAFDQGIKAQQGLDW